MQPISLAAKYATNHFSSEQAPAHQEIPAKLVADISQFKEKQAHHEAESTATQSAFIAQKEGADYRIKINPPDRLTNTFHEVLSARILNDIGLKFNPPSIWVTDKTAILIASRIIPNALDAGPFIVKEAERIGKAGSQVYQLSRDYKSLEQKIKALENEPSIKPLLEQYKKGGLEHLTEADHALLQPLRDAQRSLLQTQEKLLDHLPHGAAIRSSLLLAAYAGEVVGEWDFLNHARFNTMLHTSEAGHISAQTVDRGVSGLVGFGGKLKTENQEQANKPARISDPFLHGKNGKTFPENYNLGFFSKKDMDFTKVSDSFGLIGSIPRSASSAFIFRHVIQKERENLDLAPGKSPTQGKHTAPPEAMQVAWLLKHWGQPERIGKTVAAAFADCREHPVTRKMLDPSISGVRDEDHLAQLYSQRISAIVARSESGGALDRWARDHPEESQRIKSNGILPLQTEQNPKLSWL